MNRPIIIGSGQYNWDIVRLRDYPEGFVPGKRNPLTETTLTEEVGGTCGNIMCLLARMGWDARPQLKIADSDEGRKLASSLADYGCDLRYVSAVRGGGFSGMICTHRRNRQTGERELGLRSFGPDGSRFRKITELRVRDEVPAFLDKVEDTPDVYFFDHNEAGPRAIASELHRRGALVYYECENSRDPKKFLKSVEVADIIKFSDENLSNLSLCEGYGDKLFIQTCGADGLQFKLRGGDWIKVDPVKADNVTDTEGCGDTITAVFLDQIYRMGFPSITSLTDEQVRNALKAAAAKAALCAQSYGTKNWL